MKIVNSDEFKQTIAKGTTVVDFYADWCGPCKMLGPVLEGVASNYPEINFVKVNCDESMDIADEYRIMSIPAVFMFVDGQVKASFVGYKEKDGVERFIKENK